MPALWIVFRRILHQERWSLGRGAALSVLVLLAGAALLGLSGWFITAAAAAGLAGIGAVFDVFRPSAMVRFLALGRTAARYGERLLTHDATLRALASLRVQLLENQLSAEHDRLARLRGAQALNRLTADVDALDGVPLRLVLPLWAGLVTLGIVFAALWWLADLAIGLWVVGGYLFGAALILTLVARTAVAPSRRAELARQAFRSRFIDLLRARGDLTIYGLLPGQREAVLQADARRRCEATRLDVIERRGGMALALLGTVVSAGALALGVALVDAGTIGAPVAALGFFVALALLEAVMPLRRAMADLGRMTDAARRVAPAITPQQGPLPAMPEVSAVPGAALLRIAGLGYRRPGAARPVIAGLDLTLAAGETLAITGRSGAGKSTLLLLMARMLRPESGEIRLHGVPLAAWPEPALRLNVALVTQRSALIGGSLRDNLALARPLVTDAEAWAVLEAVALTDLVHARGGLGASVGAGGRSLSGGEARRLALARALLRRPRLLLLDEPTEGLDAETSRRVLAGLRAHLPDATIVMASHRALETEVADRVFCLDQR